MNFAIPGVDRATQIDDCANPGGLDEDKVYIIKKQDVAAIPAPDADTLTVSTDITFTDPLTQGFVEVMSVRKVGNVDATTEGDTEDTRSVMHTCVFVVPKINERNKVLFASLEAAQVIILVKTGATTHIVGTLEQPARVTPVATSGASQTDQNIITYTAEAPGNNLPPLTYTGTITEKP